MCYMYRILVFKRRVKNINVNNICVKNVSVNKKAAPKTG